MLSGVLAAHGAAEKKRRTPMMTRFSTRAAGAAAGARRRLSTALTPQLTPQQRELAEQIAQRRAAFKEEQKSVQMVLSRMPTVMFRRKKWYIIDPRKSRPMNALDACSAVALMFTAFATPFEVAFLPSGHVDALFVVNRVVDAIFVIDLVVQFFVMFPLTDCDKGVWVHDPSLIRSHYLRGWFAVDVFSIAVSGLDVIALYETSDGGGASKLKILRAVRALRLVKLVRLPRGPRIFKRWETRVS